MTDIGRSEIEQTVWSIVLNAAPVGPVAVCAVPCSDLGFVAVIERFLRETTAGFDAATFEAALVSAYPQVRVVEQVPVARLGLGTVWYAYRDGGRPRMSEWDD